MPSFEKAFNMKGFDRHRTNRWQMVPHNGTRYIIARDAAAMSFTCTNTARVNMTEIARADLPSGNRPLQGNDRILKLEGKAAGSANVLMKDAAGTVIKTLEMDVKRKKTVNISFNFVRDNAGHTTARSTASAAGWVAGMHHIFFGQSNIAIRLKTSRRVTVAQNLGAEVTFTSHIPAAPPGSHEWPVVTATGDGAADMNFFLVWEYEQDLTAGDGADAGALGADCIFEDAAGTQISETMAHETGHFLGVGDHYVAARSRELMYGITDTRGVHLPKAHVNTMNP